ncbi:MAG: hypothetical protein NC038_07810, partial [Paludibacter sp.]|nr:hypothetical protein [Prevotella sp.]MCM1443648.1 hypothetical protein [Muribaculum sp.]MCM1482523.1 hypothetical protein [Paludibacter sp.]MCM1576899.1 hypothetical protein [Bacteroides sp.]
MAKKVTKEDLLKSPIDFLYIFTNNTFVGLVRKYMGNTQANTIAQKAANQRKYLSNVYGGTKNMEAQAYSDFENAIYNQYDMTPVTILRKLLAGETVAGKNWKEGVYGIGATKSDGFKQNANVKVDTATGTIVNGGVAMTGGTATYDKKGNAVGYSFTADDGTQYSSRYDKRSGKWYANTYSTAEVQQYADGTTFSA